MSYRSIINKTIVVPLQQKKLTAAIVVLSLVIFNTSGQDVYYDDTININAVTVTANNSLRNIPFNVVSIDSGSMAIFQSDDLGTLLQSVTPLSVKRNGNTGLTTVAMRGMSGSHTTVSWNGISITGPNTGMSDLALIPVFAATSVLVKEGGGDLEGMSGSIGGTIELSSHPAATSGKEASFMITTGSYNDYSSLVSFNTRNDRVAANLSIWGKRNENNFVFINDDNPDGPIKLRRTNASSDSWGLITDLYYIKKKSTFSTHLWYSSSDRALPGPVTTVQQDFEETQNDRSFRGVIKYRAEAGKCTVDLTSGISNDVNIYNNAIASIRGDNRSLIFTVRSRIKLRLNENFQFTLNLGDEYQEARSLSYEGQKDRNLLSSSLTASFKAGSRVRLFMQSRELLEAGRFVAPEFTAGGSFLISRDGESVIKANVSHNLKLPTLNDLYWSPGGNPDLDPEISTGGELGYSYITLNMPGVRQTFDLTLHASSVHNLIQWVPGNSAFWTASNVRDVKVKGIETRLTTIIPLDKGKITATANYALTSSIVASSDILNDKSPGKQLLYTPLHHINLCVTASYRFLRYGAVFMADSKRFTTADNSEWMPPSSQLNANLGAVVSRGRTGVLIDFSVENILNTAWESVRNYPMPLRTYMIKLKFSFSSNRKNEI